MSSPGEARSFRFGVSLWTAGSAAEWRAKARRAEELGYDVILLPDHIGALMPPLTALMTAADATERVHIGTLVLNNDFHNPVLLAREAASLQLLSGGRFELGLGAGHMQSEYEAAGIAYEPAAARVDRLQQSVKTIHRLFSGEPIADGLPLYPPLQQPIPLLVGGNGRRVLELAAKQADIVGFTGFFPTDGGRSVDLSHFTAAGLASRVEAVQAVAGPRFGELELNALVQAVVPAPSAEAAAEGMRGALGQLTVEEALDSPFLLLGSPREMAEALLDRRRRFGLSYFAVFEAAMEAFAPVIAEARSAAVQSG